MNFLCFRFPIKNSNLLKKWLSAMGAPDFKPSINAYLCSTHFKEYDYEKRGNQKILKPNSVPSIFKQQTIERDTLVRDTEEKFNNFFYSVLLLN